MTKIRQKAKKEKTEKIKTEQLTEEIEKLKKRK